MTFSYHYIIAIVVFSLLIVVLFAGFTYALINRRRVLKKAAQIKNKK